MAGWDSTKAERILLEALSIVEEQYAKRTDFTPSSRITPRSLYAQAVTLYGMRTASADIQRSVKEQYGERTRRYTVSVTCSISFL